jgi:hypothetical protein
MSPVHQVHEFVVTEPEPRKHAPSEREIRLGTDVIISNDQLRQYLARRLQPEDVDLLLLAGVVARIDRTVKRHLASAWARRLHVNMCVHEPERWNRSEVRVSLQEALNLLTGDIWSFEFRSRSVEEQALQLNLFAEAPSQVATMPYSGGLDSYCGLASWEPAPTEHRLLVHTRNSQSSRALVNETLRGQAVHHVSVPIRLPGISHAEDTYRARTFTFLVAAAVGARLGNGTDVVVSENGQGSLGPALVRFPGEHPYYSTHPLFTRRLSIMLKEVWADGHVIRFLHPAVWSTKGEILAQLSQRGSVPNWQVTRSCSRTNPRNKGSGAPSQCGVCGGCLLRRLSLDAAGLAPFGSNAEGYLWADLSAERLEDAATFACDTTKNDRCIAVHAVVGMAALADFASAPANDHSVLTLAEDLAYGIGMSPEDAESRVRRLVQVHRSEWHSAIGKLPPSSWLRQIADERVE